MIVRHFAAVLCSFIILGLGPARAIEYREIWNIEGGDKPAAELGCPVVKKKPITTSPSHEADLRPPDEDELAALGSISDRAGSVQPLPKLREANGRPLSIAIWGDSHTAAGFFSEQLIESMGLSQEEVAPSFLPATVSLPGVRLPIRKSCRGGPWQTNRAYVTGQTNVTFSRALSATENTGPGAYLWIDFRRVSNVPNLRGLKVLFSLPEGASSAHINLQVDDKTSRAFMLSHRHAQIEIRAKKPFSVIRLKVESGTVVVDGFVPTYNTTAKLVLDTLSIPGATIRAWKMVDTKFLRRWGPPRPYDLAMFQYGTNEGNSSSFKLDSYRELLREALRGFRSAYPDTACVLLGPPDRGSLVKKRSKSKSRNTIRPVDLLYYPRLHRDISDVQSKVGHEFGCYFWSWQKAMGGLGGMYRWHRTQPPLASHDLIHLTKQGYQESARRLEKDVALGTALGFSRLTEKHRD